MTEYQNNRSARGERSLHQAQNGENTVHSRPRLGRQTDVERVCVGLRLSVFLYSWLLLIDRVNAGLYDTSRVILQYTYVAVRTLVPCNHHHQRSKTAKVWFKQGQNNNDCALRNWVLTPINFPPKSIKAAIAIRATILIRRCCVAGYRQGSRHQRHPPPRCQSGTPRLA